MDSKTGQIKPKTIKVVFAVSFTNLVGVVQNGHCRHLIGMQLVIVMM